MFDPLHAVGQMRSQVRSWLWAKLAPIAGGVVVGVALDAMSPRRELEQSALLRHQVVVLRRKLPRPRLMPLDSSGLP